MATQDVGQANEAGGVNEGRTRQHAETHRGSSKRHDSLKKGASVMRTQIETYLSTGSPARGEQAECATGRPERAGLGSRLASESNAVSNLPERVDSSGDSIETENS